MVALIGDVLTKLEGLKASEPSVEFTYRDLGAKKIGDQLDQLGKLALTVGFQGASALTLYDRGDVNVATVALFNEFGTQTAPARPFMRRAITENLREIEQLFAEHFAAVVELRETAIEAMDAIGRAVAHMMVKAIDTAHLWAVSNAPSTVANKGHGLPLFDTGLMQDSITWAVRTGGPLGSIVREGAVT